MASGTALAQIIAVLALPLLARLYDPPDLAHYALLLGAAMTLAAFSSLRFDSAIPLPEDEAQSRALFWVALSATAVVLPLLALVGVVLVFGPWDHPLGLDVSDVLLVLAFTFVLCLFNAAAQLAIRQRSYGLLGRIPLVQMLGTVTSQTLLGIVDLGRGLFIGGLLGRCLGIAGLVRSTGITWADRPKPGGLRRLVRRYWRFPVLFAPAALVGVLGTNLVQLLLPALYGLGPAGLFAMAYRLAGTPAGVISDSASQVFLGEFARATTRESAIRTFLKWSASLGVVAVCFTLTSVVVAPVLLPVVLGPVWEGTATLTQYAAVAAGAAILGSPVQQVWTVRERGLWQFGWSVLRLAANVAVLVWGTVQNQPIDIVIRNLAAVTLVIYIIAWLGSLFEAVRPLPHHAVDANPHRPGGE